MDVTKLAAIPFLNQAELPGQGAVGQLQATQAGNQLLGVQSRQLKSHRTDAWLLSSVEHLCGLRLIGLAVVEEAAGLLARLVLGGGLAGQLQRCRAGLRRNQRCQVR